MPRRMHPTIAAGEAIYRSRKRQTFQTLEPGDRITFDHMGERRVGTVLAHHGDVVSIDCGGGMVRTLNIYSFGARVNEWKD